MPNKCECELAGYCERHRISKTQAMVDACRRSPDMFLHFEMMAENIRTPNIVDKVANYAIAEVKHTLSGRKEVSNEIYERRLAVCRECPLFNSIKVSCDHQDCGCYLEIKAKWADSECPVGKWGRVGETDNKGCGNCSK